MKKGQNEEYDNLRMNLFELKMQIGLLKLDSSKEALLEEKINKAEECLKRIRQIEFEETKGKEGKK